MEIATCTVPGTTCAHCTRPVRSALSFLPSVRSVEDGLAPTLLRVHADGLSDAALRAAIDDAGYEATR